MSATKSYIELSALQQIIKGKLSQMTYWVRAEVASYSSSRGHSYFDLIEKGADGTIAAKVRAAVWASSHSVIDNFEKEVGKRIDVGMSLVFRAEVSYHPQYGLSLIIREIDPAYTIGERELQRKATIERLTKENLLSLQRDSLTLPCLPGRIAVVSSRDAAGFGDFCKHLADNPYGYVFDCTLFHSLMQGESAPSMMIDAFARIYEEGGYDLVVIMRGGGADADMYCFDDYALCKTIAQFPVPVFTAVGHEKDHHICDMVSFKDFKTPTALADALIQWTSDVEAVMLSCCRNISEAVSDAIQRQDQEVRAYISEIKAAFVGRVERLSRDVAAAFASIRDGVLSKAEYMDESLRSLIKVLRTALLAKAEATDNTLLAETKEISFAALSRLEHEDMALELLDAHIRLADPREILRQGYVLAVDEKGTVLRGVRSRKEGDSFSLRHIDGLWRCKVDEVKENK